MVQIPGELVRLCFVQDALKGKDVHEAPPEAQELSGRHVVCVTFLLNGCFGHFRKILHILGTRKRCLRERLSLQEEVSITVGEVE